MTVYKDTNKLVVRKYDKATRKLGRCISEVTDEQIGYFVKRNTGLELEASSEEDCEPPKKKRVMAAICSERQLVVETAIFGERGGRRNTGQELEASSEEDEEDCKQPKKKGVMAAICSTGVPPRRTDKKTRLWKMKMECCNTIPQGN
eukprot:scaffold4956_cov95-Cylindrotheca_fusiformis.AAC.3